MGPDDRVPGSMEIMVVKLISSPCLANCSQVFQHHSFSWWTQSAEGVIWEMIRRQIYQCSRRGEGCPRILSCLKIQVGKGNWYQRDGLQSGSEQLDMTWEPEERRKAGKLKPAPSVQCSGWEYSAQGLRTCVIMVLEEGRTEKLRRMG